jgi:thiamine biosynthesis lipoprotein
MSCSAAWPSADRLIARACTGRPGGPRALLLAARCLLALVALTAPGCTERAPPLHQRVIPVFGTLVLVEIAGAPREDARAALDAVEALYRELDRDWRAFGAGELGRANAALAAGSAAELTPRLARLVQRSLDIHAASDGLFDPRVGTLVALWGFQDMAGGAPPGPPADEAVQAARSALHSAELRLDGTRLTASAPVALELAGIAKGAALAAGARLLAGRGIEHALIVAGGDLIVLGRRGTRPWRIGVRDPLGAGILGTVELAPGEAALSSGNYERRYEARGQVFHHIIDPRTGRPARGAAGVTVIHRDAELGNAAAAALMVGGPGLFHALAARLGIECALLVAEDGARLLTPCMEQRLALAE